MSSNLYYDESSSFSTPIGLLYMFNLIVGTGVLTLPKAFQIAGYTLSIVLLVISAFTSYVCTTFIIECLSIANAVIKFLPNFQNFAHRSLTENNFAPLESTSSGEISLFEISRRFELSEMSHIFLGKAGVFFTYLSLSIYLFGDMVIYTTAVPKCLTNIICLVSINETVVLDKYLPCYPDSSILPSFVNRFFVYRVCVIIFSLFCMPMVLAGITRIKYIQLATTITRWTAFLLMIILASIMLVQKGPQGDPPSVNIQGFGSFFGVSAYAFMIHHSLPSLVLPIRNKSFLNYRIIFVYIIVFCFYCTLSLTGSFAFKTVMDIYTLNFFHGDKTGSIFYIFIDYFLALFPVFTITSSYIIITITLTNNVKVLFKMIASYLNRHQLRDNLNVDILNNENEALLNNISEENNDGINSNQTDFNNETYNDKKILNKIILLTLVIGFPTLFSLFTDNVLLLASVNGSYPGVAVQYIIPSILILGARSYFIKHTNLLNVPRENASPFHQWFWPYITIAWGVFAMFVVASNFFHLG